MTALHALHDTEAGISAIRHDLGDVILAASGLSQSFGGQAVLDGVDVTLRRGEVILLRGDNGSGKTTLLNILTGNLEPDEGCLELQTDGYTGVIQFPRLPSQRLRLFERFSPESMAMAGVGRTWQDFRLFGSLTLRENLQVASQAQAGERPLEALLRPLHVHRQQEAEGSAADLLLDRLGLGDRVQSSGDRISLGQAKRVAISRAVRAGAEILLLDEPLAGLDSSGIRSVIELLRELVHREGLTLVIVEHVLNISRLLNLATTVWTLEDGKLRVQDPNQVREEVRVGDFDISSALSRLVAGRKTFRVNLSKGAHLDVYRTGARTQPLLEARDLVVQRGQRLIIGEPGPQGETKGLSFILAQGDIGVLCAPNGWGKTSLLESIAGLIPVRAGQVLLEGSDLGQKPPWQRSGEGVSLVRARENSFPGLRVEEALRLCGAPATPSGLKHLATRHVSELSGGERQKVALESALARPARAYLLDEPFSALDHDSINNLESSLSGCLDHGAVLIAIPSSIPNSGGE